jgi:hypothetical protein
MLDVKNKDDTGYWIRDNRVGNCLRGCTMLDVKKKYDAGYWMLDKGNFTKRAFFYPGSRIQDPASRF